MTNPDTKEDVQEALLTEAIDELDKAIMQTALLEDTDFRQHIHTARELIVEANDD